MNSFLVVYVTIDNQEHASFLASKLVEKRLVACVNIIPRVQSVYWWEGQVCTDSEYLLIIKTTTMKFDELQDAIKDLHPYDIPEIIALPIVAGSEDYLSWVEGELSD